MHTPLMRPTAQLVLAGCLLFAASAGARAETTVFDPGSPVLQVDAANTDYEGHAIVVDGATLTVDGHHTFEALTLTNGQNLIDIWCVIRSRIR